MLRKAAQVKPKRPRTDAFTFAIHWIMVAALIVSLLTGLRIAADYHESVVGRVAEHLDPVLLQGAVIEWHVWASWTLVFAGVAYALFLWRARQVARVALDRSVVQRIAQARRHGRFWADRPAWFAVNVVLYQAAFALVLLMAATGWMLYTGYTFGISRYAIATVHGVASVGFIAYVVVHTTAQLKAGTLWKIFRPRAAYTGAAGLAACIGGAAVVAAYAIDRNHVQDLEIARVESPPVLDGDPSDPVWDRAQATTVHTVRGANLPNGEVEVEVRAVHDGGRAYFRFRWADPQRSQKHLPLVKVEGGWKVMQSEFDINDEDEFYEDKFAVVLARKPSLASGTVHLGQDVGDDGPHRPTTRGLHYTTDGSYADMWHWKSIRTGGMEPPLVDDNYFGPPKPSEEPGARYTGGYSQDPSDGGGYTENFAKVDPDKPLNETLVVPKFLPADRDVLGRLGEVDLDPNAGDDGEWYLRADEAVPYNPALDDYPIGTVLPGVVIEGPFQGDRGDLLAGAEWKDGFWTLEVARKLDTGSRYDVPLVPGEDTFLWVVVFNHTQTRHSQHLHPIRLVLGEERVGS